MQHGIETASNTRSSTFLTVNEETHFHILHVECIYFGNSCGRVLENFSLLEMSLIAYGIYVYYET